MDGEQSDGLFPLPSVFSDPRSEEGIVSWTPKEKTYETDLAVLQWVEELEQRVILSDLQIRVPWAGTG